VNRGMFCCLPDLQCTLVSWYIKMLHREREKAAFKVPLRDGTAPDEQFIGKFL
jgi:hypothetical protein